MKSMVELSHDFLKPICHTGAICVDATLGRGKDSQFFLNQNVSKVYAFEIQEDVYKEAINHIHDKRFYPFLLGHEKMNEVITDLVDGIVFNFGYCPGKDKSICTQSSTSVVAIEKGLNILKKKGRMALVIYPHNQEEVNSIECYLEELDSHLYSILKIKHMNLDNSPYIIEIEKR